MQEKFRTLKDLLDFLEGRGLFHVDLSLDRMYRALKRLSLTDLPFPVVQVLGTNGKGSTATILASLCQAHGLVCGLYTSPHFVSPMERIQILGSSLSAQEWVWAANRVYVEAEDLTYFEFLTILALLLFSLRKVDICILEAGLGGANDATSAVERDLLCYTPVALDHCAVLGGTLEAIAFDKAQAMREGALVCSCSQFPKAGVVLEEMARKKHCTLIYSQPLSQDLWPYLQLQGVHQRANAGLAVLGFEQIAQRMHNKVCLDALKKGLAAAFIPGRMQQIRKGPGYSDLLLDGAHNPHGMQTVLEAMERFEIIPKAVLYAGLADKDWPNTLRILRQKFGHLAGYFPQLPNERATDAKEVAQLWGEGRALEDVGCAMQLLSREKTSEQHPILVVGSLYLLAEIYKIFPQFLISPH